MIRLPAIALLAATLAAAEPVAQPPIGIAALADLDRLPLLCSDTLVHYEGSMDKRGGNADWDWWLYQAGTEWVLAEIEGPGCLYNFVAHHAVAKSDPLYRFYFDGEAVPRFEIRHSEFGRKPPFAAPLADWYGPHLRSLADARIRDIDFRIVRSFVPMPFARGCRVTSSVKLEGNEKPGGGWGHVMYHTYPTAMGVSTFTGSEDLAPLREACAHPGRDPKPIAGDESVRRQMTIQPQQSAILFERRGAGVVRSVQLQVHDWRPEAAAGLWIRCTWDGESAPAIDLPLGAFFGNETALHPLQTLAMGLVPAGTSYQFLPMPFWSAARVEVVHRGAAGTPAFAIEAVIRHRPGQAYDPASAGHLRASTWRGPQAGTKGEDALVSTVTGSGHVVAGWIAALDGCEGDIRVNIDGCSTPAVESDGSESWACYGWGFYSPPEANPFSAYDGNPVSMLRLTLGDRYPFRSGLRLSAEHSSGVRRPGTATTRSGGVLWYGRPAPAAASTDLLDVGDPASEAQHGYRVEGAAPVRSLTARFEGAQDHLQVTDEGRHGMAASAFTLAIDPRNRGVLLRRRSSQAQGRHRARVWVDGVVVAERAWIWPDRNPHQAWLEDEFQIPASYVAGKSRIALRLVPEAVDGLTAWNEYRWTVWSLLPPDAAKPPRPVLPAGRDLPPLPDVPPR